MGFLLLIPIHLFKENLVVQPDSNILDFNIISEEQTDTHFIIKIRSAVGKLRNSDCENKGLKKYFCL